jgi:hypothetical protein
MKFIVQFHYGENMKKTLLTTETSTIALTVSGFNLKAEAAQILHDFPQIGENIIFAMADAATYTPENPETYGQPQAVAFETKSGWIKRTIEHAIETGVSTLLPQNAADNKNNIIAVNPHENFGKTFGTEAVQFLEHEMGHLVTPTGLDARLMEASADAYMTLRLLQRFGEDAVKVLSGASAERAYGIFANKTDYTYLTSPVIDKIIEDSRYTDFKAFSPAETAALASQYARDNYPEDEAIQSFYDERSLHIGEILEVLSNPEQHSKIPELLSGTILASPQPLLFSLGAGFIQSVLSTEVFDTQGKAVVFAEDIQQEVQKRITERAKYFNQQAQSPSFENCRNELCAKVPVVEAGIVPQPKTAAPSKTLMGV